MTRRPSRSGPGAAHGPAARRRRRRVPPPVAAPGDGARHPPVRAAVAVGHPPPPLPATRASTSPTPGSRCGRPSSGSGSDSPFALVSPRHGPLPLRRAGRHPARRARPGDAAHRLRAGAGDLARLRAEADPRRHGPGLLRAVPVQRRRRLPVDRPRHARAAAVGRRVRGEVFFAPARPPRAALPLLGGADRRRPRPDRRGAHRVLRRRVERARVGHQGRPVPQPGPAAVGVDLRARLHGRGGHDPDRRPRACRAALARVQDPGA